MNNKSTDMLCTVFYHYSIPTQSWQNVLVTFWKSLKARWVRKMPHHLQNTQKVQSP